MKDIHVFYCSQSTCHFSTTEGTLKIKSPDPETYFKNRDHAHTFRGFCYGIIVIFASFVSIGWFITWTLSGRNLVINDFVQLCRTSTLFNEAKTKSCLPSQNDTSYLNKMTLFILGLIGFGAGVMGIGQIDVRTIVLIVLNRIKLCIVQIAENSIQSLNMQLWQRRGG